MNQSNHFNIGGGAFREVVIIKLNHDVPYKVIFIQYSIIVLYCNFIVISKTNYNTKQEHVQRIVQ